MSDEHQILNRILYVGDRGTAKVYIVNTLLSVSLLTGALLAIDKLFDFRALLGPFWVRIFFAAPYALLVIANTVLFLSKRYYSWNMRVARRRANIVFAFNLTGLPNVEKFRLTYGALVNAVRNEIATLGLADRVKITEAPTDSRLSQSAAEAMTRLGLMGSTLLVWGHVVRTKTGKKKFLANFSYEYGYKKGQRLDAADMEFKRKLDAVLGTGVLSPIKLDATNFTEQITPTVLLILSATTLSLGRWDDAEAFLNAFVKHYDAESNLMRKKELAQARISCNEMLLTVYREHLSKIGPSIDEHLDVAQKISEKVLRLSSTDYASNVNLAYIHESRGDSPLAHRYALSAALSAPPGYHDHTFDSAYFALKTKNYAAVLPVYESIPLHTKTDTAIVSNFLYEKYRQTKDVAYLFADSYVRFKWDDGSEGEKGLKRFLARANPTLHTELIAGAKKILGI